MVAIIRLIVKTQGKCERENAFPVSVFTPQQLIKFQRHKGDFYYEFQF